MEEKMNELLVYFSYANKGNNYEIFKDLVKKRKVGEAHIRYVLNNLEKEGIKYVTVFDSEYPTLLKNIKYAPYVLYYKGDLSLVNKDLVTLTGDVSNIHTEKYFNGSIESFINQFSLITSDFTSFDRKITQQFRDKNKGIVHVLASGHNYLPKNAPLENELYISQYPPEVNPKIARFKERNVIISALSSNLVIYGAKQASGIINLANAFADMNKEVYCYPSLDLEDGNNFLLKNGANLITHVADVIGY